MCSSDLPYLHIWDEPQLATNALRVMQTADFDPHFFHYGSLLLYVDVVIDSLHALTLLGASPRNPEALSAVGEVVLNQDPGWHWQVSHPSFYYWNRLLQYSCQFWLRLHLYHPFFFPDIGFFRDLGERCFRIF